VLLGLQTLLCPFWTTLSPSISFLETTACKLGWIGGDQTLMDMTDKFSERRRYKPGFPIESDHFLELFGRDPMGQIYVIPQELSAPLTALHQTRQFDLPKKFVETLREGDLLRVCDPSIKPLRHIIAVTSLRAKLVIFY
jgi:hypothetical protein